MTLNGQPPAARAVRIVYWASLPLARAEVIGELDRIAGVRLQVVETLAELLAAIPGAMGIILYDAPPAQASEVIGALRVDGNSVQWMHFLTAGREGFDAIGFPKSIAVTHAAGGAAPAVAEHAMALLLALGRCLPQALQQSQQRKWDRSAAARAFSLEGKTIAIIGYGHIGRQIALRARNFGVRLVAVSRSAKIDQLVDASRPLSDLHQVLPDADAVVITIALSSETHHLFDAAAFDVCKRGAFLINVARGGIVDQTALCRALESGQIAGAGLDVTDPEPLPETDPLWRCPNLIITPHFAGAGSPATLARLADSAAVNLRRLLAGRPQEQRLP